MKVELGIVGLKKILPILSSASNNIVDKLLTGVHILRTEDKIVFRCTDLTRDASFSFPVEFQEEREEIIVSAKSFCDCIKGFPGALPVSLETKGQQLLVSQGRTKHKLSLFEKAEISRFPRFAPVDDIAGGFYCSAEHFSEILWRAFTFADHAKSAVNSVLSSVFVKIKDEVLKIYATDSSGAFIGEVPCRNSSFLDDTGMMLPITEIPSVKCFLDRKGAEDLRVIRIVEGAGAILLYGDAYYRLPLGSGTYPHLMLEQIEILLKAKEAEEKDYFLIQTSKLRDIAKASAPYFEAEKKDKPLGISFVVLKNGTLESRCSFDGNEFFMSSDLVENTFEEEEASFLLSHRLVDLFVRNFDGEITRVEKIPPGFGFSIVGKPHEKTLIARMMKKGGSDG